MLVIYVSGPYSAPTERERDENVNRAKIVAQILLVYGFAVIVPHTMTYKWEEVIRDKEKFMRMDFELIRRCDAVLMLPGWEQSEGSKRELAFAVSIGKPVFTSFAQLMQWAKTQKEVK